MPRFAQHGHDAALRLPILIILANLDKAMRTKECRAWVRAEIRIANRSARTPKRWSSLAMKCTQRVDLRQQESLR